MSITGKKIAIAYQAIEIAKAILRVESEAIKHAGFVGDCMRRATVDQCISMTSALMSTPHQYFDANGKIDKRKKRKHDRKAALKPHASGLIRVKVD